MQSAGIFMPPVTTRRAASKDYRWGWGWGTGDSESQTGANNYTGLPVRGRARRRSRMDTTLFVARDCSLWLTEKIEFLEAWLSSGRLIKNESDSFEASFTHFHYITE